MNSANEPPSEPPKVNRIDAWMASHPQYIAGIWAFFALTTLLFGVTDEAPYREIKIALAVGWALLAVREVRRFRAQR